MRWAKVEVLATLGKRLNMIAETDPYRDDRHVWREFMRRTVEILKQENGFRNSYPVTAIGLEADDPQYQEFRRVIARASDRARWAACNMAAMLVLRGRLPR